MIEQPTIIITSLGRTGTKFFHALFEEIIPDATSLHEPDVFNIVQYRETGERIRQILKQIRESGVYNMIIRKALGKWSLIELSDARVRGELGYAEAVQQVLSQREEFVRSRSGSVYVEANIGYYGLIDVLRDVYEHCRIVYIIRDGRDWIRSHINWGQMYGKGKIRSMFAHTWPAASNMKDDPYRLQWKSMSRFERLCWAWVRLNEYALGTIQENPNARVFRFEDVFQSRDRYQHLADLVRFSTMFPNTETITTGSLEGWPDRQIHKSVTRFPLWEEWSTEQKGQFKAICGLLMKKLDYEFD
jgi:hypothetical protein